MNRKRTRRKTRGKTKQNIRKNNTKPYNKNSRVEENKRKSVGGGSIVQAAKNTLLASKYGAVKVNLPEGIHMSCSRCGDWNNFYIYTIHAYGKFLYCGNGKCMAVQGFAARV